MILLGILSLEKTFLMQFMVLMEPFHPHLKILMQSRVMSVLRIHHLIDCFRLMNAILLGYYHFHLGRHFLVVHSQFNQLLLVPE
jgi:hypothetical protein